MTIIHTINYIFITIFLIIIKSIMKVQLSKDPLFEGKKSPVKEIKMKEIERQRIIRFKRMNPISQKQEVSIQVIDPLPIELSTYRNETSFKKSVESSKASSNLRKYVIEQQKNLRCLRLQRIDRELDLGQSRAAQLKMNINLQSQEEAATIKEINIPKIQETFTNQQKQYFLFENRLLKQRVTKMMNSIDKSVIKSKTYSLVTNEPSRYENTLNKASQFEPLDDTLDDFVLDKKLVKSQKLQNEVLLLRRSFDHKDKDDNNGSRPTNLVPLVKKQKVRQKMALQGVKSFIFKEGDRQVRLTNASKLLFDLHKQSNEKQLKESELTGLLKNSFQNRDSILNEKSQFYSQEKTFNKLNPSHQFELRKIMNKKLAHRLELSREQINKFIDYIREIKEQYHVIINETILEILKEVRETLLSGKVMKLSDLQDIVNQKDSNELKGHPNQLIISKLCDMMI